MPKLSLNISDAQPDLIPDGVYEGVIKSFTVRPKKDQPNVHQVNVLVAINDDGDYQGRTVFRNYPYSLENDNLHWLISDLELLGVDTDDDGLFDFDYDDTVELPKSGWPVNSPDIVGVQCWVKTIKTSFDGKENNKFEKFVPEPAGTKIS